jgi:hypothetical protein
LALTDLNFTGPKDRKAFTCQKCPVRLQRKCEAPGFDNLKSPLGTDANSLKYPFCPAKATWYPEIMELWESCRVAYHTGIMPKNGGLEEQPDLFTQVFPAFVDRYKERTYARIWTDVQEYTGQVLTAVLGKK